MNPDSIGLLVNSGSVPTLDSDNPCVVVEAISESPDPSGRPGIHDSLRGSFASVDWLRPVAVPFLRVPARSEAWWRASRLAWMRGKRSAARPASCIAFGFASELHAWSEASAAASLNQAGLGWLDLAAGPTSCVGVPSAHPTTPDALVAAPLERDREGFVLAAGAQRGVWE